MLIYLKRMLNYMEIIAKHNEKLIKFVIHSVSGVSFGSAQKMLRQGDIKVNGKRTKENVEIKSGDIVSIYTKSPKAVPNVDTIYEDENILVVMKPSGMECATRDKSSENTYSLEEIFETKNAVVVHRLDRLTEGLVILAKGKLVASKFERIFKNHEVQKTYKALLCGNFKASGEHIAYLHKDSKSSKVTISDTPKDGYKEIITDYSVLKNRNGDTLVEINLKTGRTHQIRAMSAHLGHPVVNDSKYGSELKSSKYKGYYLTAYKLSFSISDPELCYLNDKTFEVTTSW